MISIVIPDAVNKIISILEENGFAAYVVGGCVRDSILGKIPRDWDVCTSAAPEDLVRVFADYDYNSVGLRFGILSVCIDGEVFEVTSFRSDSVYFDGRRPDNITLVSTLEEDLYRRDFTINAMAYGRQQGLIDVVGGLCDLRDGVIRCIGNAKERFQEDSLRILRAIRFALTLDFSIDQSVRDVIYSECSMLGSVSIEGANSEFCKMIVCHNFGSILKEYSCVFVSLIPELCNLIGFDQNNKYHVYDIFDHTICALENCASGDLVLRLAVFFHDFGKPFSYQDGEDGYRHFKGHAEVGASIADSIMHSFRFDNSVRKQVVELVLYHDTEIGISKRSVKRWLNRIGLEQFQRLLELKRADAKAHAPEFVNSKLSILQAAEDCLSIVLSQQEHFTLKDLAVNGKDLIEIGFSEGKVIGATLDSLLQKVINSELKNDRIELLLFVQRNL